MGFLPKSRRGWLRLDAARFEPRELQGCWCRGCGMRRRDGRHRRDHGHAAGAGEADVRLAHVRAVRLHRWSGSGADGCGGAVQSGGGRSRRIGQRHRRDDEQGQEPAQDHGLGISARGGRGQSGQAPPGLAVQARPSARTRKLRRDIIARTSSDDRSSAAEISAADSPPSNLPRSAVMSVWVQRFSAGMMRPVAHRRVKHATFR